MKTSFLCLTTFVACALAAPTGLISRRQEIDAQTQDIIDDLGNDSDAAAIKQALGQQNSAVDAQTQNIISDLGNDSDAVAIKQALNQQQQQKTKHKRAQQSAAQIAKAIADPADRAAVEEALAGQNLIKRAPGKMPSKNLLHSFSRRHAGALIQAAGGVGRVDGFVDALLKRAVENGGISANALASLEGSDLAAIQDAASRSGQSVDELTAGIIKRGLSSNVLVDHLLK